VEFERALICWDQNQYRKMFSHINKAIRDNPDRMQYYIVRGNMNVERQKFAAALKDYDKAQKDFPNHANIFYGKALCYEGIGQEEKAICYLEKTLELRKVYMDACEKLSDYYQELYHETLDKTYLDKSIDCITRQIEEGENCYYLVHRGLIYMNSFELELAMKDFRKALEHSETDWAAWNNLGCCYKYLGQPGKAITCFQKAEHNRGSYKTVLPYSNMADCYEIQKEYEKAIECYRKALKIDHAYVNFWGEIGDLYTYLDRYDDAFEMYRQGNRQEYYKKLGDAWLRRGDRARGIRYYKKWVQQSEGTVKATRLLELGIVYGDELGEYRKAVRCFRKALGLTENRKKCYQIQRSLAKVYFLLGDSGRASKHARLAMEHFAQSGQGTEEDYITYKPYRPIHLEEIGWLYACLGDIPKAQDYFRQMEQCYRCRNCRFDQCFESRLYLGDVYRMQGDAAAALAEYQETLLRNPYCREALYGQSTLQEKMQELTSTHST
jgi:tetratricopeptide (TPR) repeat protein